MTSQEKRQTVANKYAILIGRNYYSQTKRDYCYRKYSDGLYYSDCSSSVSYAYKEAGLGFGILNTAGMYYSSKLTFVDVEIKKGIPTDFSKLRVGDMLLFAGSDSTRPQKIGHIEMIYSINSDGTVTICGHGSGRPSFKDLKEYCTTRYNSWAGGGWRKQLVCIKRYIQDDGSELQDIKPCGWVNENGGWRYYLAPEGNNNNLGTHYVQNDWYKWQSDNDGKFYWSYFDTNGFALTDTLFTWKDNKFYFNESQIMIESQWRTIDGHNYYFTTSGEMATSAYVKSKDVNSNTYYWVDAKGRYCPQWDTTDTGNYPIVI